MCVYVYDYYIVERALYFICMYMTYCAVNNFEYFSLKLDQRVFQTPDFCQKFIRSNMPPKAVPEPISHDKSVRINCGQNRHFEEHASAQPAPKNHVEKPQQIVIHSDSNDEP